MNDADNEMVQVLKDIHSSPGPTNGHWTSEDVATEITRRLEAGLLPPRLAKHLIDQATEIVRRTHLN